MKFAIHPACVIGDQVEAAVLNVDPANSKISLGMKQTAPNPWDMVEAKYPSGTRIEGKVKSLTDFGAFVGLEEGIDGSSTFPTCRGRNISNIPPSSSKKGRRSMPSSSGSTRKKSGCHWVISSSTAIHGTIRFPTGIGRGHGCGKVSKIADFGIFVELDGGVEGLDSRQ